MARRFAVISLEIVLVGRPRSSAAPLAMALPHALGRYRRYETTDCHREMTHEGRVADLLTRSHGDLRTAILALLADWRPPGGPAGFPPPPPRGTLARRPEAA